MIEAVAVVLVVGLAVLASLYFRMRGYSPNQRIVLSGIAATLLVWSFRGEILENPGQGLLVCIAVAVLLTGAFHVGKSP